MNTSDTFKLPEGRFDSIGWLAFATAYTANGFLDKLRALMHENADLFERLTKTRGALEGEQQTREYLQARRDELETQNAGMAQSLEELKAANARNAERILKKKRKK
ncbi:MAG: hypothetical protein IT367_20115 [Candidatus Hydrogenedentes bacterium]|nr:hypothetical protein [Candidatus Hydrogenedentota bacterium]